MFVLLVGYFSKIGNKTEKYVVSTFNVLALFLVFNIIMGLCYPRHLSLNAILTPQTGAWFLLSLFFWRITMVYMKPLWINRKGLAVCLGVSVIAGFCPLGDKFAFMRTFDMFPFLFIGLLLKGTDSFKRLQKIPRIFPLLIILAAFGLIYFFHPYQNYIYSGYHGMSVMPMVERMGFTVAAVVLGLSVYCILPHGSLFLAKLGQKTLFIYVYHLIILRLLIALVNHFALPTSLPYLAVYVIAIISLCCVLSNIHILDKLTRLTYLSGIGTCVYKKYLSQR